MRLIGPCARAVSRPLASTAGVVAAAVGLAVGELVASLTRSLSSPVISIGNRVVDAVPQPVKQLAIDLFGTDDKIALIVDVLTGSTASAPS